MIFHTFKDMPLPSSSLSRQDAVHFHRVLTQCLETLRLFQAAIHIWWSYIPFREGWTEPTISKKNICCKSQSTESEQQPDSRWIYWCKIYTSQPWGSIVLGIQNFTACLPFHQLAIEMQLSENSVFDCVVRCCSTWFTSMITVYNPIYILPTYVARQQCSCSLCPWS